MQHNKITSRPLCAVGMLVAQILFFAAPVAQSVEAACSDREELQLLNFWIGDWSVYSGDRKIGTNSIEKILGGCAVAEHWTGMRGNKGESLFYYLPQEQQWKQVWVTENPFSNGGVKEKAHIATLESGAVRFQGTVITSDGTEYLDRTTLQPLDGGNVEQLIEISADGGSNWREAFRGLYKRSDHSDQETD